MNAAPLYRRGRLWLLPKILRRLLRPSATVPLVRLGTDYGGWWVPEAALVAGARAYCAGVGEDVSFDMALAQRGVLVEAFDPTPRAVAFVEGLPHIPPTFRFHAVGWWGTATELKFFAPADPAHVSHSAVNLQGTSSYFIAPVKPIHHVMEELGHETVDIIKMDIEGAEYEVLTALIEFGPRPGTLCVEFDQPQPVRRTIGTVRRLHVEGYTLARIDGWNYTFVRAAANGARG